MCEIMDFANELDNMISKIPSEVNRWQQKLDSCNDKKEDFAQLLENKYGKLNAWQLAKISKHQALNRIQRREAKYQLKKWKHLKGAFYDKHNSSSTHLQTAKEWIRKEDIRQKNMLSDKESAYKPRAFDNLYDDDFVKNL